MGIGSPPGINPHIYGEGGGNIAENLDISTLWFFLHLRMYDMIAWRIFLVWFFVLGLFCVYSCIAWCVFFSRILLSFIFCVDCAI